MPNPPGDKTQFQPRRERILVMRYRFIGDTLLMVPFLRNLRAAHPEAVIDVLVAPNSGELLRDCPYINELIWFDTTRRHRYENGDGQRRSFWSYVLLLRARQYDTAFVLKRSFSSAALAWLAGIPTRIGFNTELRGPLLTTRIPYRKDAPEIECFSDALRAAGIPVRDTHLECWWTPDEEEHADKRLRQVISPKETATASVGPRHDASPFHYWNGNPLRHIVLHLTSSNRAKQWPETQALQLAESLLSRPNMHIHCLGAASDQPLYDHLAAQLPEPLRTRLHNHCGALSLHESMAFMDRMDLVVGVDSGTLHMAAAVGVPVIALFGPMDERKWSPVGATVVTEPVSCRPCNLARPCRFEFQCMTRLSPETVLAAIEHQLREQAVKQPVTHHA